MFLTIFHFILCVFLIFHHFQFSRYTPSPALCISDYAHFQCFLPYSISYSVCVSFSKLFSFHAIFQVLQYELLRFHVVQCFSLYSSPPLYVSNFPFYFQFSCLRQVLQCSYLTFHVFQCFSLYSRSYSVCFSFSKFTRYILVPTVCISHFPRFSGCLP